MTTRILLGVGLLGCVSLVTTALLMSDVQAQRPDQRETTVAQNGQSVTHLPDGRWLLLGGRIREEVSDSAAIFDPATMTTTIIGTLIQPRADHTATVLPDGSVLVIGGRSGDNYADIVEVFDPAVGLSAPLPMTGASQRALHTATLLADGRIFVTGGLDESAEPLPSELWDLQTQTAANARLVLDRTGHTATLLADGRILVSGGRGASGRVDEDAVIVDTNSGRLLHLEPESVAVKEPPPQVSASIPQTGATDVPLSVRLAVRFSDALQVQTLNIDTVRLTAGDGRALWTRVVAAEDGRLVFVWPLDPLGFGETYTLTIDGPRNPRGMPLGATSISFTTVPQPVTPDAPDTETWEPTADDIKNGWKTNRPRSPWELQAPLMAPPGVTAISGRVLTLDGRPLREVTLEMDGLRTQSDETGRFLLLPRPGSGRRVLDINGLTANGLGRKYGFFEYGMTVEPNRTNVLPFTIWMPRLDTRHLVRIPASTMKETVVTTPSIPGLELHIPPQTTIRDEEGNVVEEIGITAIPVDRPPFPLAKNVQVPVYFTIQPGGSYVHTTGTGPKGAWLVYPNYRDAVPGQRVQFFHYEPPGKGWYVYGPGTVSADGSRVVPDPATRLYEFTGAMINTGDQPPVKAPTPEGGKKADPVDPSTGVFSMHHTDLYLRDVIPVALTRTYNSGDNLARSFGRGMTNPYAMFLWSANQYQEADLILPEGGKIHYVRISSGTDFTDAVFEHTTTPTIFYKSRISWNGDGWDLVLKDGTVFVFGDEAPLQAIRDRYGNTVTIDHGGQQFGNVTQVTSPSGRWIKFTYDASNRVSEAKDNIGRTVTYTYVNGNLSTVTDPENNVTTYTYDASNRMATIKDGRNIVFLTNTYDSSGRVTRQSLADPEAIYQLTYTADSSGNITQTDITDPGGHVERVSFDASHQIVSEIEALGTTVARTRTIERQPGTGLITAVVDGLGRRTEYTYNSAGRVLTITRLAGTAGAVTSGLTYEPLFSQLATITDPLNHTWSVAYDAQGRIASVTDPLTHQTTFAANAAGQVTATTDALQHTWQIEYLGGVARSSTDPLGAAYTRFVDAAGRAVLETNPLGASTRVVIDKDDRVTAVTDPAGGETAFAYDPNGQVLSLTDALSHGTIYTYDASDRVATRTDPLQRKITYQYDKHDNLIATVDRKGQITTYEYDALDRLTLVTYQDDSTVQYTYDAGDRATQIVDSTAGTITRVYDGLDRLSSETTPQGTVSYTYDADGRRATMTVSGQPTVTYSYDDAHRLTSITRGTAVVGFTYDAANRQTTLTMPNGVVTTRAYDNANRLTGLTYTHNTDTLGDLTYTYDADGNVTSTGGMWASTGLPPAVASATYDASNQLVSWGGQSYAYDANGNLASDGATSYVWNARDELIALSGATVAGFQYDGVGRRRSKTVGSTTSFLYDGPNVVQELVGGSPAVNWLTGGINQLFERTDAAGAQSLLSDSLGSTVALTDAGGVAQTHYIYEPFGATTSVGVASTNAVQFTGRESDGTDLYYFRSRYAKSSVQRFVSEDTIGFGGGDVNLHAYALNAPTRYVDPTGQVVVPGGWFPSCEKLRGRKHPSWWERVQCILEMDSIIPGPQAIFSPGEVQGLRLLFGRGLDGVRKLLERLRAGERIPLPETISPQTLQKYREVAERAIQAGKDAGGVQAGRQEAIDLLIKQGGGPK